MKGSTCTTLPKFEGFETDRPTKSKYFDLSKVFPVKNEPNCAMPRTGRILCRQHLFKLTFAVRDHFSGDLIFRGRRAVWTTRTTP